MANIDWQLGIAYRKLGDCDKAIEHFDRALGEFRDTQLHAIIQVDIGFACLESKGGDRLENVLHAIQAFKRARELCVVKGGIRSSGLKPYALSLIGDAYGYRALRELGRIKDETHKKQLPVLTNELRQAARVARMAGMQEKVCEALFLLGQVHAAEKDYVKAYRALAVASRVTERLARSSRTIRMSRHWVSLGAPLYDLLIRSTLKYAHQLLPINETKSHLVFNSVVRFAEQERTIFLQTELAKRNLLPRGANPEGLKDFFALRRQWHSAELQLLEQEGSSNIKPTMLHALRQKRDGLEAKYLDELDSIRKRLNDPEYDPDTPVRAIGYRELVSVERTLSTDEATAIVQYHITDRSLLVIISLPGKFAFGACGISRRELDEIQRRWEHGLGFVKGETPAFRKHWKHWENGYLRQTLHRMRRAADVPASLIAEWERDNKQRITRVILIPHRFLHLLPIHAIALSDGKIWGESVSITYAPSASVLYRLMRSDSIVTGVAAKAVAIAYSLSREHSCNGDQLFFHGAEVRVVKQVTCAEILGGEQATPEAVKEAIVDADYVHFACHGKFDGENILNSALRLFPDARHRKGELTLGEVFESVHLHRTRLVVLSACDTGLIKLHRFQDECLGFPAAFLYAGAKTVIGSLWRVPDLSTWLLMRAFWHAVQAGAHPAEALRRAKCQLQLLSLPQIRELIFQAASDEKDPPCRETILSQSSGLGEEHPFASAYWWAGFTVNGLG